MRTSIKSLRKRVQEKQIVESVRWRGEKKAERTRLLKIKMEARRSRQFFVEEVAFWRKNLRMLDG